MTELKDKQLNNVTGGEGDGVMPDGGITFSSYSEVEEGRFYISEPTTDEKFKVVYVNRIDEDGEVYYQPENFTAGLLRWSSYFGGAPSHCGTGKFHLNHMYVLNVRP